MHAGLCRDTQLALGPAGAELCPALYLTVLLMSELGGTDIPDPLPCHGIAESGSCNTSYKGIAQGSKR